MKQKNQLFSKYLCILNEDEQNILKKEITESIQCFLFLIINTYNKVKQ